MSKRRVFDIDFPDTGPSTSEGKSLKNKTVPAGTDQKSEAVPAGTDQKSDPAPRRGPMASAIGETAEALRERQSAEAAIRDENDRLAHEHVRLKKQGLIVDLVPLDQIRTDKLTRDRAITHDPELADLMVSIQAIGLSNPIRVEQTGDGYELIQGYRRLSAYRALYAETGDEAYAKIPAGLVAKGEALEGLYRRMVDENLVRRDISFAEMAELARAYAADPETPTIEIGEAVNTLYGSAGRQKRIYIKNFASLLDRIGDRLKFAETVPRALGLDLEKLLSAQEGRDTRLRAALATRMAPTPEAEQEVLRAFLRSEKKRAAAPVKPVVANSAKTTFRYSVPAGTVRCAASDGRLEMRLDRDFSTVDRNRLEEAVAAFFDKLDG